MFSHKLVEIFGQTWQIICRYIKPSFSLVSWVRTFSESFILAIWIVKNSHYMRFWLNKRMACTVFLLSLWKALPNLHSRSSVYFKSLCSWFRIFICFNVVSDIVTHFPSMGLAFGLDCNIWNGIHVSLNLNFTFY